MIGQFADRGGFARTVDASHHDDQWLDPIDIERRLQRDQQLVQRFAQGYANLFAVFEALFAHGGAQTAQQVFGDMNARIAGQQRGFQFFVQIFVNLYAGKQARQAFAGFAQAVFETAHPFRARGRRWRAGYDLGGGRNTGGLWRGV